jgi:hypothetical protein
MAQVPPSLAYSGGRQVYGSKRTRRPARVISESGHNRSSNGPVNRFPHSLDRESLPDLTRKITDATAGVIAGLDGAVAWPRWAGAQRRNASG